MENTVWGKEFWRQLQATVAAHSGISTTANLTFPSVGRTLPGMTNPFIERGRIRTVEHFVGRWRELSLLFDMLEAGRPVFVLGPPGIGKSSLLTHVTHSAAVTLEIPTLRAFYLDLQLAESSNQVYRTLVEGLGDRGDTAAALEVALVANPEPVIFCLDNAQGMLKTEWGVLLIETLARMVRGDALGLVVVTSEEPPLLSERFARLALGAFAAPEVRLLTEAYLEESGVSFTPAELRELAVLSVGHPAYLQRAAFHLFRAKLDPSINWRAAYLEEARTQPIAGAPLPPAIFEGESVGGTDQSTYGVEEGEGQRSGPQPLALPQLEPALLYLLPLLISALLLVTTSNLALAAAIAVLGVGGLWFGLHQRR